MAVVEGRGKLVVCARYEESGRLITSITTIIEDEWNRRLEQEDVVVLMALGLYQRERERER